MRLNSLKILFNYRMDRNILQDKSIADNWSRVDVYDWSYVYISGGEFEGSFGYYDDEDDREGYSLIYFGAPLLGDGPYSIKHSLLRKPEAPYLGDFQPTR